MLVRIDWIYSRCSSHLENTHTAAMEHGAVAKQNTFGLQQSLLRSVVKMEEEKKKTAMQYFQKTAAPVIRCQNSCMYRKCSVSLIIQMFGTEQVQDSDAQPVSILYPDVSAPYGASFNIFPFPLSDNFHFLFSFMILRIQSFNLFSLQWIISQFMFSIQP